MNVEMFSSDSPRWPRALAGLAHDVYHLPGFARLFAREEGGEAVAFLAEEGNRRLLLPMIVRPIDEGDDGDDDGDGAGIPGRFDATCPYGYPGPVVTTDESDRGLEDFLDRALECLGAEMLARGIVCAFARLHPLLGLPLAPFRRTGKVVRHGETVSIGLTRGPEGIWQGMNATCRNQVNKAGRMGQVVRVDEAWKALPEFLAIYRETMDRRSASASYYFDEGHLLEMREILGDRATLLVAEIGGELAAGAIFLETNGIVNYHLSGTRAEFVRNHPSRTILHRAAVLSAERGHRVFHLGGGRGGARDSLFDFKASFSPCRHAFHTWRFVADETAYRALVDRWRERSGGDPDGREGFFPAYRRPIEHAVVAAGGALLATG